MKKLSKKTKRIIAAVLAGLTGASATLVASAVIAYEACFPRFERPDYSLVAGEYCYERIKSRLPREEFTFPSGETILQGYYYPAENGKGLVVLAHGFHAGADDYLPMIEFVVQNGFNVFTYDVCGVYSSGGEDMVGMCQSLVDLDNALSFVKTTYAGQPLFLLGHSWGGYAVTSALALHKEVLACAAIAPMYSGYTVMYEKGAQYVGKLALTGKAVFDVYQKLLFKDYVKYNGVVGINSTNAPVFIAQGIDDTTITYDGQSITAHKDEITNPNIRYYETKGLQGDHNNLWHSLEAIVYQNEVASEIKLLEIKKGSKLTTEELREFYKTVNHRLYSAVNEDLLSAALQTFETALG